MPNRTIWFPRRQQQLLVTGTSEKRRRTDPLLINQGAVRGGQGQGVSLRPMAKQSPKVATIKKLDSPVSQTGPSGFVRLRTEGDIKDHRARNGSGTSFVSSRTHA
jgi:hypothetical protein